MEQELHEFISKINRFHDTIKFTFNYSNKEANFLNVNNKMKENGVLDTSVHEKAINCHQYIEFSSCHSLSRKQCIPYSQVKRYRRITSDHERFENDIGWLKKYFLTRTYPKHIEEAVGKVFSMSIDVLKTTSPTKCQDSIPFECTYNPSLPNLGKIINQYWNLLKYSKGESVTHAFNCKLCYKRPSNLQDMLVYSQLNRSMVPFQNVKGIAVRFVRGL